MDQEPSAGVEDGRKGEFQGDQVEEIANPSESKRRESHIDQGIVQNFFAGGGINDFGEDANATGEPGAEADYFASGLQEEPSQAEVDKQQIASGLDVDQI